MIRDNGFTLRFTQLFILCFRCIVPLGSLYLLQRLILPSKIRVEFFWPFEIYLVVEVLFYLVVFVPRRHFMQQAQRLPPPPSREDRQQLFQKCLSSITDPTRYVCLWTGAQRLEDVRHGDVAEWLNWALLNETIRIPENDDEIEGYIQGLEALLHGWKFPPGRSRNPSMRISSDQMNIMHRPLTYYICGVAGSDLLSYLWMSYHGYQFYALTRYFTSIPWRLQTIFCANRSPAKHTAYWYRPHTSKNRLPILYIHGIGILHTYLLFFTDLAAALDADASDGQVGILVLDVMPISFRMTHASLSAEEFINEIATITSLHRWERFVIVGNSFGTALSLQLLKSSALSTKITDILMIDPVVFLLHCPEMVHNFLRRSPRTASEWQLWYFASADIGASHTLARRFSWSQNILWREDMIDDGSELAWKVVVSEKRRERRKWTIVLSQGDIIVDAFAVGKYLTREDDVKAIDDMRTLHDLREDVAGFAGSTKALITKQQDLRKSDRQMASEKNSENMEVLWFDGVNHAEVFDYKHTRKAVVDIILGYCKDA